MSNHINSEVCYKCKAVVVHLEKGTILEKGWM